MRKTHILFSILGAFVLGACEETIHPTLQSANPVLVVDAFITNKTDTQRVVLTYSQPYFQEELPPGVSGAAVLIKDNKGNTFFFNENPNVKGSYEWVPSGTGFGTVGNVYTLSILVNGQTLTAQAKMGRVPKIDSITFKQNGGTGRSKNFYRAQFWATDPLGPGDTYWIKAYKNGVLLDKPSEINLAYDAGFSAGSDFDGVTFIQPVRSGINTD